MPFIPLSLTLVRYENLVSFQQRQPDTTIPKQVQDRPANLMVTLLTPFVT